MYGASVYPRSILATLVFLLVVAACARNPVTGQREFSLMTESQEISLGREADPQIVSTYGLYDEAKLQDYVDHVGQKMARLSHRPDLTFTFRVLDSPVINAFALPGGFIYVTRGILAHMNNEAELAMVLGHEIGHVTARHGVSQYSRAQLAGIGLGLGSVFVPEVARFGQLAESALGLLFLKYGRDDERQSDELGVEYSLAAGYDAVAGARFFEVLDRMSEESGSSLPSWLSTHPAPARRVSRTRDLAMAGRATAPGADRIAETDHKRLIDALVFGEDPRQGFVVGDVFKHPSLRFQIDFPRGWQIQNTPSAVLAGEPKNRAMLQMTLEPSEGASPSVYASRVAQSAGAAIVEGGTEWVHGAEAFVAVLQVTSQDGSTMPVLAGFVQRPAAGPIYQIVGYAEKGAFGSFRGDFLYTIRTLRTLSDRDALGIEPNRVVIEKVKTRTTLEQALATGSEIPVPVGVVALLNNLDPGSTLAPAFELKVVRGTYRPAGHAMR